MTINNFNFGILVICFLMYACGNSNTLRVGSSHTDKNEGKNGAEEDFEIFYEKFHSDSVFQLSRIKFPLKGVYLDSDNVGLDENGIANSGDYVWTKDTWHRLYLVKEEEASEYLFETKKNGNFVIKIIQGDGFGFYFEERFESINGEWYLVYLIDKFL